MLHGRLAPLIAAIVLSLAIECRAAEDPWIGWEATRSRITTIDLDSSAPKVVLDAPHRRYSAPEWTPDGSVLIVNGGGQLWRLPASGGTPAPIPIDPPIGLDINHAISPDGRAIAFTNGAIWKVPAAGGRPTRVTTTGVNWMHAWSPDGKRLAYASDRGNGLDLYAVDPDGRAEVRLTTDPHTDDTPQYSPDGRWIYFLSDRAGTRDIWRIPAAGAGPGDAKAEQITRDDRYDTSPHPSPDGKWLIYVSYPPRTPVNAVDRDVVIRRIPLGSGPAAQARPQDIARLVGGYRTLGARPFSPDGRRLAYASFEPPPPTIRIVLHTASDRTPPQASPIA